MFAIYITLQINCFSTSLPVWSVTTTDTSNYNHCFLGNGIVGIRTHKSGLKTNEIYINGLYDAVPGGYPTLTNYYKPMDIALSIKGSGDLIFGKEVTNWEQTINLKEAILYTNYTYANKIKISCKMAALRNNPQGATNTIQIEALENLELTISNQINLPDRSKVTTSYKTLMGYKKFQDKIPVMYSLLPNLSGEGCISGANAYHFPGTIPELTYTTPTANSQKISFNIVLKKGEKYSFGLVASFTHNGLTGDPFNDALRACAREYHHGIDYFLQGHISKWEELWKNNIVIKGDELAQRDINVALYSLYSSIIEGMDFSIPPCGLSSDAWGAHIFWDSELWMYPALLVMQPKFAESMLKFRYNTREQCRKRALLNGYKGIMFPWESDMEGNELCTVNYKIDMNEHHVTADVGIAFWNYYLVTRDKEWLKNTGYEIIRDVADFWASRTVKGKDGKFHILTVIGPDEYHEDVDDNAFTNGAAKQCLLNAIKAATLLGEKPNTTWQNVADNIVILKAPEGHTLQYQGYKGEVIKQADVNLLSYPLNVINEKSQIIKDLNYYEPKIDPLGPAMGYSVLSILYSRLGNVDKGYEFFNKSYKDNLKTPFFFMSEIPNNTNTTFCTGYGGMLQTLIYGFGGLNITDNGLVQQNQILPTQWKSLTINTARKRYKVANKELSIKAK